MIEYNIDGGRTLIAVGEWEDMYERVGFKAVVDEAEDKLKEVIARYSLKSRHSCGLKSCRTPHNRGYLVVFNSGSETCIGNRCVKNILALILRKVKMLLQKRLILKSTESILLKSNVR